jgi:transposase-like protein
MYLNNIIEQDHRFIKKITKPMMGFKAFHSAQATIAGIETAHMIREKLKNVTSHKHRPPNQSIAENPGNVALAK